MVRKKNITWILFLLLGLAITAGSSIFFLRSDFFTIKAIEVSLEQIACANTDEIKNLSRLLGQNFFLINSSKVSKEIKNKFLCVKYIKLSRYFPNKIIINAYGRNSTALLAIYKENNATESAGIENIATPSARVSILEEYLVDEEAFVFAKQNLSNIPQIYYSKQGNYLGKSLSYPASESMKILEKIKTYGINVNQSEIINETFLIFQQNNTPRIVFKLGQDSDTQLASLQLILKQAKIDEKELEFIDLRFDKPVVRICSSCDLKK